MERQSRAYLYAGATVLLWSTVASAFKLSLLHMEPVQLLFYANLTSVILLFAVVTFQGELSALKSLSRTELLRSALLGLLNPLLYYWVLFQAYDLLPAQEAQPLNYTWAITLSLLAVPLLKQRLRLLDFGAILVSYLGILVIATHGDPLSLHFSNGAGVALALASTVIWGLYWIFNTRSHTPPVIGLLINFSTALPFVALLTYNTAGFSVDSINGLLGAVYVGLFEMGIAFILWLKAMRLTTSTVKIANMIYLSPIISLYLIHIIVGEEIHWSSGAGLLLILIGNGIQQLGRFRDA